MAGINSCFLCTEFLFDVDTETYADGKRHIDDVNNFFADSMVVALMSVDIHAHIFPVCFDQFAAFFGKKE